jgi:cytochrome oxidase Cu insertion factor (SCO1/SenC/PrrC family)
VVLVLALQAGRLARAHEESETSGSVVPGFELRFEPPEPGSYGLPPIGRVGEHRLLDPQGKRVPLLDLAAGQLAVVSFIYASCPQGWGCPLALATFQQLDRRLAEHPGLSSRVRLITVSFDPARDTPEHMATLREQLRPVSDWSFLTAASQTEIRPVLENYGQDAIPLVDAHGASTGLLRHVLKVFLIDATRTIRNIYSVGFLSPEIVWGDVQTLILEQAGAKAARPGLD